jgi:hypothetical protein
VYRRLILNGVYLMSSLFYFSTASKESYGTGAFAYITNREQRIAIKDTAAALGVSATAIAGAMAEESNDYWLNLINQSKNYFSDIYARVVNFTSDMWLADYAAVHGDIGYVPSMAEKFLHPVYMDLGQGNFKMTTAIRLVQENASNPNLGLGVYINNYSQLAADLVDPSNGVTAKLYGLMIKEADAWFTSPEHNAYGADWATLPQEIKDALYVTYVNLGAAQMQTKFNETTFNGTYDYEPLPAVGTGGGLNHLNNASAIATAIGITGYGDISHVGGASRPFSMPLIY